MKRRDVGKVPGSDDLCVQEQADAFPYAVGHGAPLSACRVLEALVIVFGELQLGAYHAYIIAELCKHVVPPPSVSSIVDKRVPHREPGKPPEVTVHRPELADAVQAA